MQEAVTNDIPNVTRTGKLGTVLGISINKLRRHRHLRIIIATSHEYMRGLNPALSLLFCVEF